MGVGKDLWVEGDVRYNNHDLAGMAALYAGDAVLTDPTSRYEGREAILTYLEAIDRPFSEQKNETFRLIEEGDTVVAEWVWRATHTAPLPMPDGREIPATGKTVEFPGVSIFVVNDGQIAEQRDYFDNLALVSQLGLMPGS